MNSMQSELPNSYIHFRRYSDKLEKKPSFQSQRQRERNQSIRQTNRQQILHESITRSRIMKPVKSQRRLFTVRRSKQELWSLGEPFDYTNISGSRLNTCVYH